VAQALFEGKPGRQQGWQGSCSLVW